MKDIKNKQNQNIFHIGINVLVIKDGKLLLGMRKNAFEAGKWGLPGGHLENREKMEDAAARELAEETSLRAHTLTFVNVVNNPRQSDHYIQIGFLASGIEGDVYLTEPDRCSEWRWFDLKELPENICSPHKAHITAYIRGLYFIED